MYDGFPVDVAEERYNISLEEWEEKQMQDPEFRKAAVAQEPAHQVERRRIKDKFSDADLMRLAGQLERAEAQGYRFERYARCGVGEHRHRWEIVSKLCQIWTYLKGD